MLVKLHVKSSKESAILSWRSIRSQMSLWWEILLRISICVLKMAQVNSNRRNCGKRRRRRRSIMFCHRKYVFGAVLSLVTEMIFEKESFACKMTFSINYCPFLFRISFHSIYQSWWFMWFKLLVLNFWYIFLCLFKSAFLSFTLLRFEYLDSHLLNMMDE